MEKETFEAAISTITNGQFTTLQEWEQVLTTLYDIASKGTLYYLRDNQLAPTYEDILPLENVAHLLQVARSV